MATELAPTTAADLANNVYAVNAGNPIALKTFLMAKLFKKNSSAANQTQKHLTAHVGGRLFRATKDGFGVCAEGAGTYEGDLFLIFRGTTDANNNADVITDARIGITLSKTRLPVHIGFNHTFSSMLPDIKQFISDSNTQGTIHCIGHSLGGAVASLAADWVSRNTSCQTKLYTFGSPRVGTDRFASSTTNSIGESNLHRVYHRTDPVTMVALYPFMHAPSRSNGHYLFSSDPLTTGTAHKMANYIGSVKGKEWKELNDAPEQAYNIESFVEGWLKSKSPVDINSASFWQWVNSSLIYVLKKVAMGALLSLQGGFISAFTLADKIAYILSEAIDLAENVSIWIELLMRKLMQALGMKIAATRQELTRSLMKQVLIRLTEKANREARNALRRL